MKAQLQEVTVDSDGQISIQVGYDLFYLVQRSWSQSFYEATEGEGEWESNHQIIDPALSKLREISSPTGWVVRIHTDDFTITELSWKDGREPFTSDVPKLHSAVVFDLYHDPAYYQKLGRRLANAPMKACEDTAER